MANHYCIQCGTLLPEDGVCLRCGAVYSFSDDGTLTIHPRKVKKVTAKAPKQKKYFAKRTLDPSEADTQTIHIPEDIFSHSDHRVNTEKHQDWTGEEKEYVPNFVLFDEEVSNSTQDKENNLEEDDGYGKAPYIPVPPKPRKKGKKYALVFLFFLILALSSVLMFLSLDSSESEKKGSSTTSQTTTTTQSTTSVPKQDLTFSASALQLEGLMIGNDRAIYNFDKDSGHLTIDYSGNAESKFLLLPLIDGKNLIKNHLSLVALCRHSFDLFENELCESELIQQGIIKEIRLYAEDDENNNEIVYQFTVESNQLVQAYITEIHNNWSSENYRLYTEVNYAYNANGQLIDIEKRTENSNGEEEDFYIEKMHYNEAGYLIEVNHYKASEDWNRGYKDTLKYDGKILKSVTPNDERRPLISFEYNEANQLVKVREITHDPYDNTELSITSTSSGDVKSIFITGIEREDTYTYSRF